MDHEHGGMGVGMFQTTNMAYARMYWYLVAGAVGGFLVAQVINFYQTQARLVGFSLLAVQFTSPNGA